MQVIKQRERYLKDLKAKTQKFWLKVVDDYNSGIPVPKIAENYINERTGKPYSRQHIHSILKQMREK